MTNRKHDFYTTMTTESVKHLIQSLQSAGQTCYGHPEFELLGRMLYAIGSAIFLQRRDALASFLYSVESELKKLEEKL